MELNIIEKEGNFLHIKVSGLFNIHSAIDYIYNLLSERRSGEQNMLIEFCTSCIGMSKWDEKSFKEHSKEIAYFVNSLNTKSTGKTALIYNDDNTKQFISMLINMIKISDHSHLESFSSVKDGISWIKFD